MTLTLIERREVSERVVESYQLPGTLFSQSCGLVERNDLKGSYAQLSKTSQVTV